MGDAQMLGRPALGLQSALNHNNNTCTGSLIQAELAPLI